MTFKWVKAGLNLEFSFSKIGRFNKTKEPSVLYYLAIDGEGQMDSCLS